MAHSVFVRWTVCPPTTTVREAGSNCKLPTTMGAVGEWGVAPRNCTVILARSSLVSKGFVM